jgi:hypothetical protein
MSEVCEKDILDFLNTTRYYEPKDGFIQIAQDFRDFVVMNYLLTKRGGQKTISTGVGIEETLMVDYGGRSEWVGEFTEVTRRVGDYLKKMKLEWCLLHDSVAYTKGMITGNKGEARIKNVIKPQEAAMMLRLAHTMEETFFGTPDPDNDLVMWGLKYWIVKNATTGFNGGYPAGFSKIANINLTEVPSFKNYTDTYTNVSKSDLIKKMRTAHRKTKWRSPLTMAEFKGDTGQERVVWVNEDTIEDMEDIGESQNENLGRDLAPMGGNESVEPKSGRKDLGYIDGDLVFRRHPIVPVPYLNDDTSDPVYMIDKTNFYALTFEGDNMSRDEFKKMPNQPRVFASDIYHKCQTICINRRTNAVLYKS